MDNRQWTMDNGQWTASPERMDKRNGQNYMDKADGHKEWTPWT